MCSVRDSTKPSPVLMMEPVLECYTENAASEVETSLSVPELHIVCYKSRTLVWLSSYSLLQIPAEGTHYLAHFSLASQSLVSMTCLCAPITLHRCCPNTAHTHTATAWVSWTTPPSKSSHTNFISQTVSYSWKVCKEHLFYFQVEKYGHNYPGIIFPFNLNILNTMHFNATKCEILNVMWTSQKSEPEWTIIINIMH